MTDHDSVSADFTDPCESPPRGPRTGLRALPGRLARLAGTLAGLGLLAGALAVALRDRWWLGELAASFDWYLGWAGAATAALLLAARAPRRALLSGALSAWILAPTLWLYVPRRTPEDGPELRVATVNLLYDARDEQGLVDLLASETLDVIAFQEVTGFWQDVLGREPYASRFPHRLDWPPVEHQNEWSFAMMLASARPFVTSTIHERPGGMPYLEAEVLAGARPVHVVCTHPGRAGRPERLAKRNGQLEDLCASIAWTDHSVLLGDLNTHSRSPMFARVLEATDLRDSRAGFGRQPSWRSGPEILLPGPLRGHTPELWTDLDHVLVGSSIGVVDRRIGPDIGSDHRPVLATLRVAADDAR